MQFILLNVMKKIITSISLLITSLSYGQITVLNSDMPRQNDTMRYSIATTGITAANAAKTGADTIWDFTNLVASSQDVEKFYAASATPYVLQFGLLNPTTYGIKDYALNNLGSLAANAGIKVENVYAFYKNNATASVLVGRGVTVSSLPLAINLNPKDTVFKFPLNYGNIDTTYYAGSTTIPNIGGISQQGRRINKVDGWGVIKTPYGTFNCIRIKTIITGVDSIEVSTFKIPIPSNKTIYTWYAKGEHYPILEITQATTGLTIKYKDIYRSETFASNAVFNVVSTSVTPKDTVNLINTSLGNPTSFLWTITPNTFRYVDGTNSTTKNPRIMFDSAASYSVNLKTIYAGGQDDTLRVNYITVTVPHNTQVENIENKKKSVFVIYPNPAKNNLFIEANTNLRNSEIILYDILGKKIELESINFIGNNKAEINTSMLSKGVYFVKVFGQSNDNLFQRIIIE